MALKQVVIVDDHAELLEVFAAFVRWFGYDVATFTDGGSALSYLRGDRVEVGLVFLDLAMPGVDGFSFLEERNADPGLQSIPVVVVTSIYRPSGLDRASVLKVLEKPVSADVLLGLLRQYCGRSLRSTPPPR